MGGSGDINAKIDAEVARTGLSEDEIGPKVHIYRIMLLDRLSHLVFQRYCIIRKGKSFGFLAFLQCMTTNFSRRRYGLFELKKPHILIGFLWMLGLRCRARPQIPWRGLFVRTKKKFSSVVSILLTFHQPFPGMWRGNRDYLLRLRICVLGRSETVVLRYAEGSACSWTSSAPWLRHQNAKYWRRDKRWYRDVSWRNASTTWKTISIICKFFFFGVRSYYIHKKFLQVSFGSAHWPPIPEYVDELIEALIEKKAPFVRLTAAFHIK